MVWQARLPAQQAGDADVGDEQGESKGRDPGWKPWSQPQLYEIRFKGHLNRRRAQMLEGLGIVQGPDGETVLTGPVIDQEALHGILSRIRDLGVPLLSVKRLYRMKDGFDIRRKDRPNGGPSPH